MQAIYFYISTLNFFLVTGKKDIGEKSETGI